MKKIILKLAVLLFATAILVSCGRAEIDPNNYLKISLNGLDTAASADFDIDYEKIVTDNLRSFGIKTSDDKNSINRAVEMIAAHLCGSPDKASMLSNGDVIIFQWDRSGIEELEQTYKIKLSITDKEITVCDLKEAIHFDPFDYLTIDYSGVEPNGELLLKTDALPVMDIPFTARYTSGLSNGDRIKIHFGNSSQNETTKKCFEQGFVPDCFEKTYIVNGVPVYVKELDDIDKESYEKMDNYAQEELQKLGASWPDKKLCDMKLLGAELYTPADINAKWGKNVLCFVYQITADIKSSDNSKKHGKNLDYYYFTYFINVFSPDNNKSTEFPAEKVVFPSYSQFYDSIYGDAFKDGDVICEGCQTLDELRKTMVDCFENSICETNIAE